MLYYFSDFEEFFSEYEKENKKLWQKYREGNISKDSLSSRRFITVLERVDYLDHTAPLRMNTDYLIFTTTKTKIIDNAFEVLNYLKKKYLLHIITDGFFEVQLLKLKSSKLSHFISNIITAEDIGYLKPNPELFEHALESVGANKEESIMIGDDYENDILGAYNFGIDQIYFNSKNRTNLNKKPTHTVNKLKEIIEIL